MERMCEGEKRKKGSSHHAIPASTHQSTVASSELRMGHQMGHCSVEMITARSALTMVAAAAATMMAHGSADKEEKVNFALLMLRLIEINDNYVDTNIINDKKTKKKNIIIVYKIK